MEVNSTANVRITEKEAEALAERVIHTIKLNVSMLGYVEGDMDRGWKSAIKKCLEDYEFESEVTVEVEPERYNEDE